MYERGRERERERSIHVTIYDENSIFFSSFFIHVFYLFGIHQRAMAFCLTIHNTRVVCFGEKEERKTNVTLLSSYDTHTHSTFIRMVIGGGGHKTYRHGNYKYEPSTWAVDGGKSIFKRCYLRVPLAFSTFFSSSHTRTSRKNHRHRNDGKESEKIKIRSDEQSHHQTGEWYRYYTLSATHL